MSEKTNISWCDSTWNPVKGCDKVSPACVNCYITETPPFRIKGLKHGDPLYVEGDKIWNDPLRWNNRPWVCDKCGRFSDRHYDHSCTGRPEDACHTGNVTWHRRKVFVLSLSDWLLGRMAVQHRARLLDVIRRCPDIDFMLLSKRVEDFRVRLMEVVNAICEDNEGEFFESDDDRQLVVWLNEWLKGIPPHNIMVGATVEDKPRTSRIADLQDIPAVFRFLSVEPMLEDITFPSLEGIHGVICGGESGPNARRFNIEWARSLRDQCKAAGVKCFMKQLGSHPVLAGMVGVENRPLALKHSKGGDPSEWPTDLRVQEPFTIERYSPTTRNTMSESERRTDDP